MFPALPVTICNPVVFSMLHCPFYFGGFYVSSLFLTPNPKRSRNDSTISRFKFPAFLLDG